MIGMGIRVMTMVVMMIMSMISMVMMVMSGTGSDSFNMMVMTLLRKAHFTFKAKHLFPVFAELAVHVVVAEKNAPYPIFKCCNDLRVVVQVTSLQKFNIRKFLGHLIRDIIDSLH